MNTVFTFGPAWDLPDPSPFVTKLLAYLTLAKIPFETVSGFQHVRSAPKGKLPYVKTESGQIIGDSSLIIQAMKNQYGDRISPHLSAEQRAIGHALAKMMDEATYWCIVHSRWADEDNWQHFTLPTLFGKMPALPRAILPRVIRRGVIKSLHQQGIGRHSPEEIANMGIADMQCLSHMLGDQPFLFGDEPCEFDAWVYAFVSGFSKVPHTIPCKAVISDGPLAEYVQRFEAQTQILTTTAKSTYGTSS
ncbi:MAG: glutathione S-transferase family protein [Lysobacterales bacterium]